MSRDLPAGTFEVIAIEKAALPPLSNLRDSLDKYPSPGSICFLISSAH